MISLRNRLPQGPRSLLDWLDEHDPGGVDATRALHFVVAVVLAIVAASFADTALGLGEPVLMPLYAGTAAGTLLFLLVSGNRASEARAMLRSAGVLVGYVVFAALVGAGGNAFGPEALTVLLVPLTFVVLYIRRYGRLAQNDGLALFEIALIVATTTPSAAAAWWLAAAAAGGAAIALAVRLLLWRPIAMRAFRASITDYAAEAAVALDAVGAAFAAGTPPPRGVLAEAARRRRRLRAAALPAVREDPDKADAVQAAKSATYRLEIASTLVAERLTEALERKTADDTVRAAIAGALDAAAAAIRPGADAARRTACGDAIALAQATLFDADMPPHARDRLLVALAGVGRIGLVAGTLHVDGSVGPAHPPAPAPPRRAGLLQTTRVAVQGLVATTATTAIYLAFDLDHGYWATLTVAFVLGGSFGETVARARTRLAGTVAGVVAGMAVALTVGDAVAIAATLAVAAFAAALVTVRDRYDVSCAFVAFGVLLGLHLISGLGAAGMIARLYDTALGAAAALMAARFVLPVALADPTRDEVTAYLARCRTVFARLWPGEPEETTMRQTAREAPGPADAAAPADTPATLATAAFDLRDRLPRLNDEAALGFRATDGIVRILSHLETIATYMTLIEGVTQRLSTLPTASAAVVAIRQARARVLAAFGGRPEGEADVAPAAATEDRATVIGRVEYAFFADALAQALDNVRAALSPAAPAAATTARRRWLPFASLALCLAFGLAPALAPPASAAERAAPAAALPTWDWIIGIGDLPSPPPAVEFLGLDGFDTPKRYVRSAARRGIRTWCYLSVGTIENWRPDRKAFEALNEKQLEAGRKPFIGKRYPEWEGERWLDVRRYEVFLPLMVDRLAMCRDKGFEFVEFDNLDAYENRTGFKIRKSDTIRYAEALAAEARRLGLKPMQKNVPELAKTLEPHFDALLFEDCALYRFCGDAKPFVAAGKPVFDADYPEAWKDEGKQFDEASACKQAQKAGVSMIFKRLDLDGWVRRCG